MVTRGLRGTGVGAALVQEFLQRCTAAGAAAAELSTVSPDAARFYESTGWMRAGQGVTFDGQQVVQFSRATNGEEGY